MAKKTTTANNFELTPEQIEAITAKQIAQIEVEREKAIKAVNSQFDKQIEKIKVSASSITIDAIMSLFAPTAPTAAPTAAKVKFDNDKVIEAFNANKTIAEMAEQFNKSQSAIRAKLHNLKLKVSERN